MKKIFVAAPDGQAGGGMGRVKDYMLRFPPDAGGQFRFEPLVTRDGRGAVFSVLLLVKAILTLGMTALRGQAAMLHVNMGDRGSVARKGLLLLTAKALGLKAVLHLHAAELEQFHAASSPLRRRLIRFPFAAADCVIVLGHRYRRWVVETLGVPADHVRIVNNGVHVSPAVRPFAGPGDGQTLLFLGNLIERKGVTDLLHAISALPPDSPPWRAVLAGGGDVDGYKALARTLGVADRVEFPGWVDRSGATALLSRASVLILPSYDEGLPLVILEAMGMGLPVLCTPVGVIPEVLTDGEHVLFVEPGDRGALTARIDSLLRDVDRQKRLSANALALFEQRFSLAAFRTALLTIYRERCGLDYRVPADPDRAGGA